MGEMEKNQTQTRTSTRIPRQLLLRVVPEQCLHAQLELAPYTAVMFGPSRKRTSAGMLNSQETLGLAVCMLFCTLQLSAAIPARKTDEQTQMRSCKQGVLLEPEAGCCLWPLVLQNLGSAHADANQRLRSTQRSRLPLMLRPGWQILSAQGAVLVKPVFFCTETGSACFHRQGFVRAPDCHGSRSFVPG